MKKSTKNQIKAEFFEFLRENDCASKFCAAYFKRHRHERLSFILSSPFEDEWIRLAFHWKTTPQGHGYWKTVSLSWEKRMYAIKYNIQMSKDETNSH